ncbi:uncharacterized protein A1O9_07792 [Exophiala aquamarina CBS 119918]|uniref:Uncharacterized protein n=1 Tax=Exophiala aquamarina CBS 119918 TaxID=1182545 RepID=A0A072P8M3_9EURO|nr:uncharacterized protein A1O9_07792 [Exophiala aquamarina CBS 119918]KEF56211.1 hypothetical protein A1O9_07792 [Exophiala aquamarina CBS 119918]
MATILPRRAGFVCQSCKKSLATNSSQRQFSSIARSLSSRNLASRPTRGTIPSLPQLRCASVSASQSRANKRPLPRLQKSREPEKAAEAADSGIITLNPADVLVSLKQDISKIISANAVPPQDTIIVLLDLIYQLSNVIIFGINKGPNEVENKNGENLADSVLRDLAEGKSDEPVYIANKEMSAPFRTNAAGTLAELTWTLVRDPKVFISSDVLNIYTRIQCLLGTPEYLPEIFNLFAHKKIPHSNSSPVTYSDPWSKLPKYAVPHATASIALQAAILKKNLPLALAVIDTTVATPAFRANKLLTKASIPLLGVGALPALAYAGSSWVASTQNTMDFEMSKYTSIAAAMAYIGTLSTIGFVAITTSNDQMERVVWRPGTHLSARWLREEEREFFDRLALAWGFEDKARRGEESGEDWQTLRDECGVRDMILDKTDLMEGMQ